MTSAASEGVGSSGMATGGLAAPREGRIPREIRTRHQFKDVCITMEEGRWADFFRNEKLKGNEGQECRE